VRYVAVKKLEGETMELSEARRRGYDLSIGDTYVISEAARVYTIRFKCKTCGATYGIEEILKLKKI
jgi:hypothetical protein